MKRPRTQPRTGRTGPPTKTGGANRTPERLGRDGKVYPEVDLAAIVRRCRLRIAEQYKLHGDGHALVAVACMDCAGGPYRRWQSCAVSARSASRCRGQSRHDQTMRRRCLDPASASGLRCMLSVGRIRGPGMTSVRGWSPVPCPHSEAAWNSRPIPAVPRLNAPSKRLWSSSASKARPPCGTTQTQDTAARLRCRCSRADQPAHRQAVPGKVAA